MFSPRPILGRLGRPLLWSVLTVLLCCAAAAKPVDADDRRSALNRLFAEGDLAGAREILRDWATESPDPRLRYNLACLEALLEAPAAAVNELRLAVELGFDDASRLKVDPDLASLHPRDDFRALIDDLDSTLSMTAKRLAVVLTPDTWRNLSLRDGRGHEAPDAQLSLRTTIRGIEFRLSLPASFFRQNDAPWYRGGGVVLSVSVPDSSEAYETARTWRFGYGLREGLPTGVLLSTPEHGLDQPVLELAPQLDWNPTAGTRTLEAVVPWTTFLPFLPPAETRFGVNLRVVAEGRDRGEDLVLIPDPAVGRPTPSARRFVPVTVPASPDGSLSFGGRLGRTIVGEKPLDFELVVWSPGVGEGSLSAEIQDPQGRSLVASGGEDLTVAFAPGRNRWRRRADLSQLPAGAYRLVAAVTLPDGSRLEWRQDLFRFDPAWLHRTTDRLKTLSAAEKPSLDWRLDLIAEALTSRDPRSSPTSVMTTVAETERMLDRHDADGSLLAPGGSTTLVLADEAAGARFVSFHAEPSFRHGEPASAVLLLMDPASVQDILGVWPGATPEEAPRVIIQAQTPDSASLISLEAWLADLLPGVPLVTATQDRSTASWAKDVILVSDSDPVAQAEQILAATRKAH